MNKTIKSGRFISKLRSAMILCFLSLILFKEVSYSKEVLILTDSVDPFSQNAAPWLYFPINKLVFGNLLETEDQVALLPGQVGSWEWLASDNAYKLCLRDGVRFTNNRTATSSDLRFSILRGLFSKNANLYQIYLRQLKNFDAISKHKISMEDYEGIKLKDNLCVEIFLSAPDPLFLIGIATPLFVLVPKESLNEDLFTWKKDIVGAGTYVVKEYNRNRNLYLENRENNKKFINIWFADVSPQYDLVFNPPTSWEKADNRYEKYSEVILTKISQNFFLFYNHNKFKKTPIQELAYLKKTYVAFLKTVYPYGWEADSCLFPKSHWICSDKTNKKSLNTAAENDLPLKRSYVVGVSNQHMPTLAPTKSKTNITWKNFIGKFWSRNEIEFDFKIIPFFMLDSNPIFKFGFFLPESSLVPYISESKTLKLKLDTLLKDVSSRKTRELKDFAELIGAEAGVYPIFEKPFKMFVKKGTAVSVGSDLNLSNWILVEAK